MIPSYLSPFWLAILGHSRLEKYEERAMTARAGGI